jgi:hypothetical protein
MLTLTPIDLPAGFTSALVVIDPSKEVAHLSGGCPELSAVVDLVERTHGPVEDPEVFDDALADLGLLLPLEAAIGLAPCPSCWEV